MLLILASLQGHIAAYPAGSSSATATSGPITVGFKEKRVAIETGRRRSLMSLSKGREREEMSTFAEKSERTGRMNRLPIRMLGYSPSPAEARRS
jgi:hypothetical protein